MDDILAGMIPAFASKVSAALAVLDEQGLCFRPYFGRRDPLAQARLWRQSRSAATIASQVAQLRADRCMFLADCIEAVGPQRLGPWRTNAVPGLSWHQWGLAVDCYLVGPDAEVIWQDDRAYREFGRVGDASGMWWGGHFGDPDHWQDSRDPSPLQQYGWRSIDSRMRALWPDLLPSAASTVSSAEA